MLRGPFSHTFFMLFGTATFGIAFVVGRQAWKQRSGSGSSETNQFKGLEKFAFFWKRMLLTCVNKILVQNGHGFSVVYTGPRLLEFDTHMCWIYILKIGYILNTRLLGFSVSQLLGFSDSRVLAVLGFWGSRVLSTSLFPNC